MQDFLLQFFTGSIVGALLTWLTHFRKSRIQPIGIHKSAFNANIPKITDKYSASILLKRKEDSLNESFEFGQIASVNIDIKNLGSIDYSNFSFGVNIPSNSRIIAFQAEGIDRMHNAKCSPEIDLSSEISEVDITLTPFNRTETYSIRMLISTTGKSISLSNDVKVSKKEAVEFLPLNSRFSLSNFTLWFGIFFFSLYKLTNQISNQYEVKYIVASSLGLLISVLGFYGAFRERTDRRSFYHMLFTW